MNNNGQHEILDWAKQQPQWMQHALHHLAKIGLISDLGNEKDNIKKILLDENQGKTINITCLSANDIPNVSTTNNLTYLETLGPVENIDKLMPNQTIDFLGSTGMTIIFGNNGTGKSGYARILKKICRAQGKPQKLRGNAEDLLPSSWNISFCYNEGGKPKNEKINNGDNTPEVLKKNIAVFDSQTANIYISDNRNLIFLPFELRLLTELAELCKILSTDMKDEKDNLESQNSNLLPNLSPNSSITKLINKLNNNVTSLPTEEDIKKSANWTDENKERYQELLLKEAQSPEKQKQILNKAQCFCVELKKQWNNVIKLLSDANFDSLNKLHHEKETKAQNLQKGLAGLASDMPIPNIDIDSDTWQVMFKHAREFATEIFNEKEEPQIVNAEHCVLCQQNLTEDARERLQRFDTFISGQLQKDDTTATKNYNEAIEKINSLQLKNNDDIKLHLQLYIKLYPEQQQLNNFLNDSKILHKRLNEFKARINKHDYSDKANLTALPSSNNIQLLQQAIDAQLNAVNVLIVSGNTGLNQTEQDEYNELIDKEKLHNDKDKFLQYRNNIEEIKLLEKCIKQCATNSISVFSKKISKKLTARLNDIYQTEIQRLNVQYLNIQLGNLTERGNPQLRTELLKIKQVKATEILSEGEQRAVALAGFLTEIQENPINHAIIFDDPVSSLDWERKSNIANRLIKEAEKRQVIIFTHDIAFADIISNKIIKHNLVKNNEINKNDYIKLHHIGKQEAQNNSIKFGFISTETVDWEYKKVTFRIDYLRQEIQKLKAKYLLQTTKEYKKQASYIVNKLRETWERAVEEIAFHNVIKRYSPDVQTLQLRYINFDASSGDYQEIHKGMSEISDWTGHDSSSETPTIPTPPDLKDNLDKLEKWVKDIKKKQHN